MPFFSVIIPLFNKEKYIENTLQSVLNQTFSDYEIIVVNDGSTDQSEAIARQITDSRIRFFNNDNQGASAARNFGIGVAQSTYIAFLDADDYWYPEFLETIHRSISMFPQQKAYSTAIEIETGGNVIPARYSISGKRNPTIVDFFDASQKECVIWTSSSIFHKDVFAEIGVFDTTILSGQDTDLWIRIGLEYSVAFTNKILAKYVYDPTSLSKTKSLTPGKLNFEKFAILEKSNPRLKKYLDLNRYALALKSKMNGDNTHFEALYQAIDKRNLSLRKRLLIELPAKALKILRKLQLELSNYGLARSVFK